MEWTPPGFFGFAPVEAIGPGLIGARAMPGSFKPDCRSLRSKGLGEVVPENRNEGTLGTPNRIRLAEEDLRWKGKDYYQFSPPLLDAAGGWFADC